MKTSLFAVLFLVCAGLFWSYDFYPRVSDIELEKLDEDLQKALYNFKEKDKELELKKDVSRGVYWADRKPAEAPFFYSICYLHGFSATRKELSPVIETIGNKLGAPVVFTRLQGHGFVNPQEFERSTVEGWYKNAHECYELASKIGQKVILVGTSTGATLASLLSIYSRSPHALVLLSPNFKINNRFFPLLSGKLGSYLAYLVFGKTRKMTTIYNKDFEYYWTTEYSSKVLNVLANLMKNLTEQNFKEITSPVLMVTTPHDKVIDLLEVEKYANLKRSAQTVWKNNEEFPNHNLAGDIVDSSKNQLLIEIISNFISQN